MKAGQHFSFQLFPREEGESKEVTSVTAFPQIEGPG